jgi:Sulfotransferase domain
VRARKGGHRTKDLTLLVGVGFEKCGTTSLAENFKKDPRFSVPEQKELFFFDKYYSENLDKYVARFQIKPACKYLVDVTPQYIRSADALLRLKSAGLPLKLIVCMRDPIQRAFSHYVHNIYYHHAHYDPALPEYLNQPLYSVPYDLTFDEALLRRDGFVETPYYEDLTFLYSIFDEQDVLTLVLETDFEPRIFSQKVSAFLGVKFQLNAVASENVGRVLPMVVNPDSALQLSNDEASIELNENNIYIFLSGRHGIACWENVAADSIDDIVKASYRWSSYISPSEGSELRRRYFAEDIERVEKLIGRSLPEWKVDHALVAKRWFGVGALKRHQRAVPASVTVFGAKPSM